MIDLDLSTQFTTLAQAKNDFAIFLCKQHPQAIAIEVEPVIDREKAIITLQAMVLWEDAHICYHETEIPFVVAHRIPTEELKDARETE